MNRKIGYEFENDVEVLLVKIDVDDYNERVRRVIKWLLEMDLDSDKNQSLDQEAA